MVGGLSLLPASAACHPVCLLPSCISWSLQWSALSRALGLDHAPPCGGILHLPQGPSLGSGLFCPGPSSLNRPHPPHSQAHRDFTAWRLIHDAFAVRERLGDPRVVPSFHCTFLPSMLPSPTPGSPTSICSRTSMPTWPSPFDHRLGTPKTPAIRSARVSGFRGFTGSLPLRPARLLAPLYGSDWIAQPSGTFTSRLSTARSPFPLLDMTTTVTGLLCWRDFHPQEWQLASLHVG